MCCGNPRANFPRTLFPTSKSHGNSEKTFLDFENHRPKIYSSNRFSVTFSFEISNPQDLENRKKKLKMAEKFGFSEKEFFFKCQTLFARRQPPHIFFGQTVTCTRAEKTVDQIFG